MRASANLMFDRIRAPGDLKGSVPSLAITAVRLFSEVEITSSLIQNENVRIFVAKSA